MLSDVATRLSLDRPEAVVAALGTVLLFVAVGHNLRAHTMTEIKFDLGQNIVETAKRSGAPRYATRDVAGYISYSLIDLPSDISARYLRPGYEIKALPLFALTLYADREQDAKLGVETVALQFDTDALGSHEAAKAFVEALISHFHRGKWSRHIDELCPAVTGRSSFLNEAGEAEQIEACAIDPRHRLSAEDWVRVMGMTQKYVWLGDGILATLAVGFSNDIRGMTYSIDLEFNDVAIKRRRTASNLAHNLAEGDAKGWNSTMTERDNISALKAKIKILEENAMKRGDTVLPR